MGRRPRPPAASGGAARLCTLRWRGVAQQRQWRRAVADIARRGARGPRVRLRAGGKTYAAAVRDRTAALRGMGSALCCEQRAPRALQPPQRRRSVRVRVRAAGCLPRKGVPTGQLRSARRERLGRTHRSGTPRLRVSRAHLLGFTAAGKRRKIGRSCRSRHASERRAFAPSRVSRRAHDGCNPPSCRRCAAAACGQARRRRGPLPPVPSDVVSRARPTRRPAGFLTAHGALA